jgi:hypothetical protein
MEMGPFDVKAGPDRFSTSDEIRAAISFLPEFFVEGNNKQWEVASDLGGHVLIDIEEEEGLTLQEELDTTAN